MEEHIDPIIDFLFEAGMLAKTPRSGFFFLGSGEQSVAEHINRTVYIGYVLAAMTPGVDMTKILKMCLFHDLAETRVSDLNYVHQKYNERMEEKAINDLTLPLPFGLDIKETIEEYEKRESLEAKIVKDSDILELILSLKEQVDIGNQKAASWLPSVTQRLKTDNAKLLAAKIIKSDSDHWWFGNKDDNWWVNRNKQG